MGYLTDIEIAQQCEMKPITEIAKTEIARLSGDPVVSYEVVAG